MNKYLRSIAAFFMFALSITISPQSNASSDPFPFELLPKEVQNVIVQQVVLDQIAHGDSLSNLTLVRNKNLQALFNDVLRPWSPCWEAYLGVTDKNRELYRTYFNGVLECRNNESDSAHPLSFQTVINLSNRIFDVPEKFEASKKVVITPSMDEFFKMGGEKLKILILPVTF